MVRLHLLACAAIFAGGCGLISSNVTDFDLSLPNKSYTVDTASWGVPPEAADVLNMSCAGNMAGVCAIAADNACPDGQCSSVCNMTSRTCDVIIPVHPFTAVNLASEKPDLAQINDQALVDVKVDKITYLVTPNTLDTATPPLILYVAPANVMSPDDPAAIAIGTIPSVAPMTTVPVTELDMTGPGHTALVDAMKDFRTPFNVLVAADVVLHMGDQIPTGKMTTTLSIEAHAGI